MSVSDNKRLLFALEANWPAEMEGFYTLWSPSSRGRNMTHRKENGKIVSDGCGYFHALLVSYSEPNCHSSCMY